MNIISNLIFHCNKSRFAQYDNIDVRTNRISHELLEACTAELKKGKAPGCDGLTAEHVVHAHPILNVLLSLLFNMMYICTVLYQILLVLVLQYHLLKTWTAIEQDLITTDV